ncbi:hypothetical protein [Chryseobacterium daeguense]|uniref:hypothetical protein n=1 Tax=Chryseobacterium daeguense TaxID=412438 RepID=UPI0004824860|nr:hypothetical protein [Chryseobacterium daeguense]
MPYTEINDILSWFQTGDYPTESQFKASWTSFWHKSELIPLNQIQGIDEFLQQTTPISSFNTHLTDPEAHTNYLAKKDASNLTDQNKESWKVALGVGSLPSNIATVDDSPNNIYGNVWKKEQSDALYMIVDEFVSNGKIMASKIEALGLTELITVTETSLSAFMANNANYEYEKNDMIAIPDGAGNYSLYIYRGGIKTVSGNYIPTGLSNITIAMVQGLQAALDAKMNKPTAAGNYFINHNGTTTYRAINPTANYLLFWNNTDFTASDIYNNAGKYGIGTTTPSEMLHLNNGRMRSKAIVFDDNTETLPNQLTQSARLLYYTDNSGTKKRVFMKEDYLPEFILLPSQLTEAQKTTWKTEMNGGFSTASMSVFIINPVVIKKQNGNNYISLRGANLYLNPANFQVDIVNMSGNVVLNVPNSQVQLISTGLDLVFYVNLFSLPLGSYKVRLRNGLAEYTTSVNFQLVDNVNSIDPSTLLWNTKVYQDAVTSKMFAAGNTVQYALDSTVKAPADEAVFIFKAKTQLPVFPAGEDFYFEFDCPALWVNGNISSNFFGLSVIADYQTLNNDIIGGVALGVRGDYLNWVNFTNTTGNLDWNQTVNVILVKRGNTLTRIITAKRAQQTTPMTFIDNVTITDGQALYISAIFQNTTAYTQQKFMTMTIKDMYTF